VQGEQPVYEELFHISVDSDETTNLAGEPRHAALLAELRAECQRMVAEAKGNVEPATVRIQRSLDGKERGKKK
jgi:hypothetical protein